MAEGSTLDGFSVTGVGRYDEVRWKKHHATQGEEQAKEPIGAPGTPGISAGGITRCTVTNNIVHHIGYTGIGIEGAKDRRVSPHIFRNITYRNMGGGIGSMRGSTAIIEENIEQSHGRVALRSLKRGGFDITVGVMPASEKQKSLKTVEQLLGVLLDAKLERKSPVVAIGGGIVGATADSDPGF